MMYQRTLRLPSRLPRTPAARAVREQRFARARAEGMSAWQASLEVGVTGSTGRVYERRRLERLVSRSDAAGHACEEITR